MNGMNKGIGNPYRRMVLSLWLIISIAAGGIVIYCIWINSQLLSALNRMVGAAALSQDTGENLISVYMNENMEELLNHTGREYFIQTGYGKTGTSLIMSSTNIQEGTLLLVAFLILILLLAVHLICHYQRSLKEDCSTLSAYLGNGDERKKAEDLNLKNPEIKAYLKERNGFSKTVTIRYLS